MLICDAVLCQVILDVMERDGLLANTREAGAALLCGLERLQAAHPATLCNARGVGTFCAFDAVGGGAAQAALIGSMRRRGIWAGGCGTATIRLRPALVFTPRHAEIFLAALDAAVRELEGGDAGA